VPSRGVDGLTYQHWIPACAGMTTMGKEISDRLAAGDRGL